TLNSGISASSRHHAAASFRACLPIACRGRAWAAIDAEPPVRHFYLREIRLLRVHMPWARPNRLLLQRRDAHERSRDEPLHGVERRPRRDEEVLLRPSRLRGRPATEFPVPRLLALCRRPADPACHPPEATERGARRSHRPHGLYHDRPAGYRRAAREGRQQIRVAQAPPRAPRPP